MKKLFCIVSFLLVMTMLPVAAFAQTQEEWNIAQGINNLNNEHASSIGNQVTDTNSYSSYVVKLEVDGGYLQLHIPIGYQLQEYELSDIEEYPFNYVFIDEGANSQFIVYSTLDNEKDQGIWLRKLYDKSNKNIIFEDVVIGAHTYIVHTKEQATYDYGFYVRASNGYSYHFQYILPYDTIQNEIPAEAISILSTLSIQEASDNTN